MPNHCKKGPIYSNCLILDPTGEPMFRSDQGKCNWYVERGLAEVVSQEPVLTIRLTFQPKGRGHKDYPQYLHYRHNRCVVCGSTEGLTQHHVIPYCYWRFLPKKHKKSEKVILCIPCHDRYEAYATPVKEKLLQENGILSNIRNSEKPHSAAAALLKYGRKIPEPQKNLLYNTLRVFYNKQEITEDDLRAAIKGKRKEHGRIVVENLQISCQEFCRQWRQHFIDHMKPKFLPEFWSVDGPLPRE